MRFLCLMTAQPTLPRRFWIVCRKSRGIACIFCMVNLFPLDGMVKRGPVFSSVARQRGSCCFLLMQIPCMSLMHFVVRLAPCRHQMLICFPLCPIRNSGRSWKNLLCRSFMLFSCVICPFVLCVQIRDRRSVLPTVSLFVFAGESMSVLMAMQVSEMPLLMYGSAEPLKKQEAVCSLLTVPMPSPAGCIVILRKSGKGFQKIYLRP